MAKKRITHDELVSEIRRVSEELGISPSKLGRDRFRKHSPIGTSGYVNKGVNWSEAKKEVTGEPPVSALPDGHFVKGVSTYVDEEGNLKGQWIKTAKEQATRERVLEGLLVSLPSKIPAREDQVAQKIVLSGTADDRLAVYPIGDPHIGMVSWAKETGSSFDLNIGRGLLQHAIDELVRSTPLASQALVCNLGDFFHADTSQGITLRSGNVLDVDSRWAKVLKVGLDTMIYLIDSCLSIHNTVHVINEIGNHDDHSAVMLSIALDKFYSNDERVTIDLSPSRFHYHRFGRNLVGVTHGHNVKHGQLESIMAYDRADDWGETDPQCRFWYCGHIHSTRKSEYRGCTVEAFRTLAARDAWATEKGYRGGRDINRIVLHREHGEIGRATVSASYLLKCINNNSK